MKIIPISRIRSVVHGTLIKGSDDLPIKSVTYKQEQRVPSNTLFFISRKHPINFNLLHQSTPCAIIADRDIEKLRLIPGCTLIQVKNVEKAYFTFVDYYRNLFDIPVVAVTGTCGKTTTKDMIKHILSHYYKTEGTIKSVNGSSKHLTYLLKLDDSIEAAVFETPVGAPGHIHKSCRYFKPNIGIITNIGVDHLDKCKTVEAYIKAKGDMATVLGEDGVLILNADDKNTQTIDLNVFKGKKIIYFSTKKPTDFWASDIAYGTYGMNFVLHHNHYKYRAFIPGYGEHQVYNCLAALAAVNEIGINLYDAIKILRSFTLLEAHFQVVRGLNHSQFIIDTWNINPTSLEAAIQTMCQMAPDRKKIALIGSIGALGDNTTEIHQKVGDMVRRFDIDVLITVGEEANIIATECRQNGFEGRVYSFHSTVGIRSLLLKLLDSNTTLLAKCSMYDDEIMRFVNSLK